MDHIGEILALGIDAVLFGICYRYYVKLRNAVEEVEVRVQKRSDSIQYQFCFACLRDMTGRKCQECPNLF
jgi:hypothetical protein